MKKLDGEQRKRLLEILVEAFPDRPALDKMVGHYLNRNLNTIWDSNLEYTIFQLIRESEGKIEDLIRAARKANSGHAGLLELAREWGIEQEKNGTNTSHDSGKYRINIINNAPSPVVIGDYNDVPIKCPLPKPSQQSSGNESDHSQVTPYPQMYHVIPLERELPVQTSPHGLSLPSGYLYLGQIDDKSGELFYRELDSHVAVLFPGQAESVPRFLIDKYAITNQQVCMFLNDSLEKGLFSIAHLSDQNTVCCNDSNGRLLAVDARSYWKHKQLTTQPWGITYQDKDKKWQPLPDCALLPATLISWQGAHLYSLWAHRLPYSDEDTSCLPTSEFWRYAAQFDSTSGERHSYPWGNEWNRSYVNYAGFWAGKEVHIVTDRRREQENNPSTYRCIRPLPVTDFAEGRSSIGCVQLIGNVWEWCSDSPPGDAKSHIIKGGACNSPQEHCKPALGDESWLGETEYIGFRCLFILAQIFHEGLDI